MSDKIPVPPPPAPLPQLKEDADGYLVCILCGCYWEPHHRCPLPSGNPGRPH